MEGEQSWPCKASQKSGNLNLQHQRLHFAERQERLDWALVEQKKNLSSEGLPAFHTHYLFLAMKSHVEVSHLS